MLVKDINPGPGHAHPWPFESANGRLFFGAFEETHGYELWMSDGTEAGTVLVHDIRPGADTSSPWGLHSVNGQFFFSADDGVHGRAPGVLAVPDSTPRLTVTIDADAISENGGTAQATVLRNTGTSGALQVSLTSSDTSEATVPASVTIQDGSASTPFTITGVDDLALDGVQTVTILASADDFVAGDGTLDVTDDEGPKLLKDLVDGAESSSPWDFVGVGDAAYFEANSTQLWKTDGTTAGTVLVKDVSENGNTTGPASLYLHNHNGTLVFAVSDWGADSFWKTNDDRVQFWKSDGTSDGTTPFKEFSLGSRLSMSMGAYFTTVGDTLFAVVDAGEGAGQELWKTDLTDAGTVQVKDINPGPTHSYPNGLTNLNGTLFFAASDGTHGDELWKSDGTSAGTTLVKDIRPNSASSEIWGLKNVNGKLLFAANEGTHGSELWASDGTASGTALVKDIRTGPEPSNPDLYYAGHVDGTLFFSADDGIHGRELWKSDGTSAGTVLVKDIRPNSAGSDIWRTESMNGEIFFFANDGTHGNELWKSDGTSAGTMLIKDIRHGSEASDNWYMASVNGTLFFNARDGTHGSELWMTDGTTAGTTLLEDIRTGPEDSYPFPLVPNNGKLFLAADDEVHGREPWVLDVPDETPTLTVTIDTATISENTGMAQAMVQRSTGTSGALLVSLSSSDTSEATVPTSVTISDGSDSATFTITGVDDAVVDGTQTVIITASAAGFTAGEKTVKVTDNETPPTAVFENALGLLTITEQQQGDRELTLRGLLAVGVQYEGVGAAAADDTGNNLDEVPQQLTSLQLVGLGGGSDLIQVSLGSNPSAGQIEETVDQVTGMLDVSPYGSATADSFFDVFVQVQTPVGIMFNVTPIHLQSVVTATPAGSGDVFEMVGAVDLYVGVPPFAPSGFSISTLKIYPEPLLGSIRGQKWNDIDGDGERDPGENGVDGWVIALRDATSDVPIDAQKTYSEDINGDGRINPFTEQGLYHFQNVPPRMLTVSEILQPGWGQTHPGFAAPVVDVDFGPGDNWIAQLPDLTETVNVDGLLRLDLDLDGLEDEVVAVSGLATVMINETEESFAGSGNFDLAQAEIVELDVVGLLESGQTIRIGGGDKTADLADSGSLHSPGQFRQQANNSLWVDSSFNVAFNVELADVNGNEIHLAPLSGATLQLKGKHDRFPIDGQPLLSQNQVVLVEGTTESMRILGLDVIAYDRNEQRTAQVYTISEFPQGTNLNGLDFANIDYASVVPPAIANHGDWALHVGPADFPGNPNPVGAFFWGTESNEIPIDHMYQQWFWYRIGDTGPEQSLDTLTLVSSEAVGNTINLVYGDPAAGDQVKVEIAYQLTGTSETESTILETVVVTSLVDGDVDFHWFEYTDIDADENFAGGDTAAYTGEDQITQIGPLDTQIVVEQTTGIDPEHWEIAAFDDILDSLDDGNPTTLADVDGLNGAVDDVTHAFQWHVSLTDQNPLEIYKKEKRASTANVLMNLPPDQSIDPTVFDFVVEVGPIDVPWWFDPAIALGYDFKVTGPNFKEVTMPGGDYGDNSFDIFVPDGAGGYIKVATLAKGETYDFRNHDPQGVSEFRLLGIEASAGVDAGDATGFPTGLTFMAADPVQVTQTAIPETIYVDEKGGLAEERDRTNTPGVIQPGDLVTWRLGTAQEQTGLVFGAAAFDSLTAAETYRDNRNLAALTTIEEAPAISWKNPANQFNVDGSADGLATPSDVLVVINYINGNAPDSSLPTPPRVPPSYYDVNGDGQCTAADVLDMIQHINAGSQTVPSSEGEAIGAAAAAPESQIPHDPLANRWFSARHTRQADILRPSAPSGTEAGMSPSSTDPVRANVMARSLFSAIGAGVGRESSSEVADEFTTVESILPDIVEDIDGAWNQI